MFHQSEEDLNNLKKEYLNKLASNNLEKDYIRTLEDGEKNHVIINLGFSVVSKRAFCLEILIKFYTDLGIRDQLIRKEDYKNNNSPLHWAFQWADLFAVLNLLEYDYNMMFWRNKEGICPPQFMYQTASGRRKHQAQAIFACVIDEMYRVLYYRFVKEKYFPIDSEENIISEEMDSSFKKVNTKIESSSFIFEDAYLCQSLLNKFCSPCIEGDVPPKKKRRMRNHVNLGKSDFKISEASNYLTKLILTFKKHFSGVTEQLKRFKKDSRWMFEYLFSLTICIMSSDHYDIEVVNVLDIDPFKRILDGKSILHILSIKNEF